MHALILDRCLKRSKRQPQLHLQWRVQRSDLTLRVPSRASKPDRTHVRRCGRTRGRSRRYSNNSKPQLLHFQWRVQKCSRMFNVRRREWIPRELNRAPSRGQRFDPSLVRSLRLRRLSRLRRGQMRQLKRHGCSPQCRPPLVRSHAWKLLLDRQWQRLHRR